jgi:hypothetical protein
MAVYIVYKAILYILYMLTDSKGKRKLRMSENSVLRILGLKREEVTGGWSNLLNYKFHG